MSGPDHTAVLPDGRNDEAEGSGRWYVVTILTFLLILSFIDRAALNLLVAPVRKDLGLADGEIALLIGASFAILYVLLGLPAGYIVDRYNRRNLVLGGAVIWTLMTFASAFAESFFWLFVFRAGVGLGEAILSPAAFSMIRDLFPAKQRSLAFGLHNAGAPLGNGASLILISQLSTLVAAGSLPQFLPVEGTDGWRLVLACTALLNLPFLLLLLTVREPTRGQQDSKSEAASLRAVGQHLTKARWAYPAVFLSTGFFGIGLAGFTAWLPTALARTWELPATQIGPSLGLLQIVLSPVGLLAIGVLGTKLSSADHPYRTQVAGGLGLVFAAVLFWVLPSVAASQAATPWLLGVIYFLLPWSGVSCATMLASLTPSRMMGKITAVNFVMLSLIGHGGGPSLNAGLARIWGDEPSALLHAIGLGSGVCILMSGLCLLIAARAGGQINRA